mmetsp:Transcript_99474/g.287130  ORF Transcript_99474/g.287130 Transcript_99474/m.287130 type:complete len:264 (-) Transcript_99474:226-1017(-)
MLKASFDRVAHGCPGIAVYVFGSLPRKPMKTYTAKPSTMVRSKKWPSFQLALLRCFRDTHRKSVASGSPAACMMSCADNICKGSGRPRPSLATSQPQGSAPALHNVHPRCTPSTVTTVPTSMYRLDIPRKNAYFGNFSFFSFFPFSLPLSTVSSLGIRRATGTSPGMHSGNSWPGPPCASGMRITELRFCLIISRMQSLCSSSVCARSRQSFKQPTSDCTTSVAPCTPTMPHSAFCATLDLAFTTAGSSFSFLSFSFFSPEPC